MAGATTVPDRCVSMQRVPAPVWTLYPPSSLRKRLKGNVAQCRSDRHTAFPSAQTRPRRRYAAVFPIGKLKFSGLARSIRPAPRDGDGEPADVSADVEDEGLAGIPPREPVAIPLGRVADQGLIPRADPYGDWRWPHRVRFRKGLREHRWPWRFDGRLEEAS
jgi:hypothetical protein